MKKVGIFSLLVMCFSFLSVPAHAIYVKDSKVYLESLEDYNVCHVDFDRSGRFCQRALEDWLKKNPGDMFKAAKMTRLRMNHWVAVDLFYRAFEGKEPKCDDEDLHLAVVSGLGQPNSKGDNKVVKQSLELLDKCFDAMKAKVMKGATITGYRFKNSCKMLMAKGALKGIKAKKCKKLK